MSKTNKTLDDDAFIYQKRENKSEKEKFRDMTFKEKWSYFLEYYFVKLLISLAVIAGLIYLFYSIFTPKVENVLYIASVNNHIAEDTIKDLEQEIGEYLNLTNMEEVSIDINYYFDLPISVEGDSTEAEPSSDPTAGFGSSNTAASQMRLTTYIAAQEIDIIIAPEGIFDNFMQNEFFDNLEDILPTDIFAAISDELFTGTTQENSVSKPYGIRLDNLTNDQYNATKEPRILGIVVNSPDKDNSIAFIRYLLENQ